MRISQEQARRQPDFQNVPTELKQLTHWVLWKTELVGNPPHSTKVPYDADTGKKASTTDPSTWVSFDAAMESFDGQNYSGVGCVIAPPYVGVDLDKCRDAKTGTIEPWAREAIDQLASYTELSPSGTGFHIWVRGNLPPGGNRNGKIEMYANARYLTVTGEHVDGTPLTINERDLANFHAKHVLNGKKESKTRDDSPSAKEWALAVAIVRELGPDANETDITVEFFKRAIERAKWTTNRSYISRTICKAIQFVRGPVEKPAQVAAESVPEHADEPLLTDMGNAIRFARRHGADMRFCAQLGYLVYDGSRWVENRTGQVERLAKETVTNMFAEAASITDGEKRAQFAKHAIRSQSEPRLRAMIELAKSEPGIAVDFENLDADGWLLNVLNGTINLKTVELQEHRREDLITRIAPVTYDANAKCPLFQNFLAEVMQSRPALVNYLWKLIGYSLTDDSSEQSWWLAYGVGANGKSTLDDVWRAMLGDYARKVDASETFMEKRSGTGIRNDLARLRGARLVTAVEVGSGKKMAESMIKQVTGGDTIVARFLHKEHFEFPPNFKIVISANHRPVIRGQDHAIWRRVRLIPFDNVIPDERQDKKLKEKLRAELPGILSWAVRGLQVYRKEGLHPPPEMCMAVATYRTEMDSLAPFFESCCVIAPDQKSTASELYARYVEWGKQAGEKPRSQRAFGLLLAERGFRPSRTKEARIWLGIGLKLLGDR